MSTQTTASPATATAADSAARAPISRLRRLLHGRPTDPAWDRPALVVLLAGTAALYLWNLTGRGWANGYYAGAAQAATQSWKALFFGSVDAANFITVDKPPASLWLMGLSGRVFGFSQFSMLLPEALCGVAAVALLYGTVRRWHGPAAGLLAGTGLAFTPVAVLMFRYNNPDALLVLLLVLAAYATTRAVERGDVRWLLLAGSAVGFGFLTKMLQAFLVLPALALVYLVAAPIGWRRRIAHLLAAGAALLVSAGWWVAAVELWPASSRPYIGGSTNNSVLQLTFGYNGLGRVFGGEGNFGGGTLPGGSQQAAGMQLPGGMQLPADGGFAGFGGSTGITRLFGDAIGGQVSWLLPAALVVLVAGLVVTLRAPRTDRFRASLLLWGGWLLVTGVVFSFMKGIFHEYYTVALGPAIAALVGVGARELWVRRGSLVGLAGLVTAVAATGGWGFVLLNRTPSWYPALRWVLIVVTVLAAAALLIPSRRLPRLAVVGAVAAVVTGLLGSAAYALPTTSASQGGPIPSAGPSTGRGGLPGGQGLPAGMELPEGVQLPGMAGGGMPGEGGQVSAELAALLRGTRTTWAAATVTTSEAASLELAGGRPVMGIGGFSGSDPAPGLDQFKKYVAEGKVRWFVASRGIGGGMPGGFNPSGGTGAPGAGSTGGTTPGASGPFGGAGPMGGGSGTASQITSWVQDNFTAATVDGQTVYDLTKEKN